VRALRVHRHGEPTAALSLDDVEAPQPGPDQVRVAVGAASLSLPDVLLCQGTYQLDPPLPFTPGLEVAGRVTAVGDPAAGELLGRRVVGVPSLPHGGFAEEALVPRGGVYPVPDGVTDRDAAATHISHRTAHVALHRRARLQPGQTLLVHAGAGGTGAAAVQLGVLAGARVIATAGSASRVAACLALGAHHAVNYRDVDFVPVVRDLTDGRGADVVFDPVGGSTFRSSQRCVASEGVILLIGFAGGEIQDMPANRILFRNHDVAGLYMGAYSRGADNRRFLDGVHAELMGWLDAGRLVPLVSAEIGLPDVGARLEALRDRHVVGRVVVDPRR